VTLSFAVVEAVETMDEDKTQAKALFFQYACRSFFMAHDGVWDQYKAFGVSEEEEQAWRREAIAYWLDRLSVEELTAVNRLQDAGAGEALPRLIELSSTGGDFARLWYANAIWQIANSGESVSAQMRGQARQVAVDLWKSLLPQPPGSSRTQQREAWPGPTDLTVVDGDGYVVNYARRMLAQAHQGVLRSLADDALE
jgi:hypothetical protein